MKNFDELIKKKLECARKRGFYRTVDLFAGCGGMSLGFHRAGFRCVSSVEIDDKARASHELNFHKAAAPFLYKAHPDITKITPEESVAHLASLCADSTEAVDVVIGGPPCQAFSRLGRAALWRLAGKDHAHGEDKRATMYAYYLQYVAKLKPIAFVMENVREIGKHVGKNIAEEIALTAEELGYNVRYTLLNAVWFGVPQLRERTFIIGIHKSLQAEPVFPAISHKYKLPVGYSTSRAGTGHIEFLEPHDHYVDHLEFAKRTSPAVTAEQAFVDLPPIKHHLDGRKGKGHPRRTEDKMLYGSASNEFTRNMRNWPGFRNNGTEVSGHIIRYTPRDYETFRRMPNGGMYPEALATAEVIFQEELSNLEKKLGKPIRHGSHDWQELRDAIVPPYKPDRYPNKFRKMWANQPSRTVPAHIGKDAYSHIHFDSSQARGISLREAARLQSFPDGFKMCGSMNAQLKQIGNAVPPLLAYAVATQLSQSLCGVSTEISQKTNLSKTGSPGGRRKLKCH